MLASQHYLAALASRPLYWFRDWPNLTVPRARGAYTIWEGEALLYVGIARSNGGLASRLRTYASGRRSGDQFDGQRPYRHTSQALRRRFVRPLEGGNAAPAPRKEREQAARQLDLDDGPQTSHSVCIAKTVAGACRYAPGGTCPRLRPRHRTCSR